MSDPTKIEDLEQECNAMCSYAEDNLKRAFAYYENEIKPQDFVPIDDDTVDRYERSLEGKCLDALVRERLYAGNMREVAGILKAVEDIERIGDHVGDRAVIAPSLAVTQDVPNDGLYTHHGLVK